jgi:release factor glutamine methyltransferase
MMTAIQNLAPGIAVTVARRLIAESFRNEGNDSAELDARLLIGHALGLDHTALAVGADRRLGADEVSVIETLAARRLDGEPVARILGRKEFWGLPFRISAATLVPRPESETVIEAALAAVDASGGRTRALRLADLGTGSGALLLALLSELPDAYGVGTDLCTGALAMARDNARALGLADRAAFVACDFGAALSPSDLVVCNPPYVATAEIAALAAEVREHDPRLALDGGADGLAGYRALAAEAARLLAPAGRLVVELGAGQAERAGALFAQAGLVCSTACDLAGIARALTAHFP